MLAVGKPRSIPSTPAGVYGRPDPLGATVDAQGVNFALYAGQATAVKLLLFNHHDDLVPSVDPFVLNPQRNRSQDIWHIYIQGLDPCEKPIYYAFQVDGPKDLHKLGQRYNENKVLLDPYSRGNLNNLWSRDDAIGDNNNIATSMRSVVIDPRNYDWEGDQPLNRPWNEIIIYEMHVRGFTQSPSSGCAFPGTFKGIVEKIKHLVDLGITAVELMPVFDFDETEVMDHNTDGSKLWNYWGYDPIGFFAPQNRYCSDPNNGNHLNEFRDMVKQFHKAGIEVYLDVVFNHTSERDENGPIINFKGLDNNAFYLLAPDDKQCYMNYSGAGNTVHVNHPMTQKLIIESLKYWVAEMHIDGFRFDEAAVLTLDDNGKQLANPPLIWQLERGVLPQTKLIAEPWGYIYELGTFPGRRWRQWNGYYRDTMRHFVKGDGAMDNVSVVSQVASVIAGSSTLFDANAGENPTTSINYVTCHDGFTLNDLVSYNDRHNHANGEDRNPDTSGWNCGVEGPTNDPAIQQLRERQIKNFFTILMLSQGIPMFVAGDEICRTQQGDPNPYCQDNDISWLDWDDAPPMRQHVLHFCQRMIAFRKAHHILRRQSFFSGLEKDVRGVSDIAWYGTQLSTPDWNDQNAHVLSFTISGWLGDQQDRDKDNDIHVLLNMYWETLTFQVPKIPGYHWYKVIDTSQASPNDISDDLVTALGGVVLNGLELYPVPARSVAVFISQSARVHHE